jgi:hypothetical protein
MTDGNRKMILYANAHTGILFDIKKNTQTLLQGHVSQVFVKIHFMGECLDFSISLPWNVEG